METTDSSATSTTIACPLCEQRIIMIGLGDGDALDVVLRRRKDSSIARLYCLTDGQDEGRAIHECGPGDWAEEEGVPTVYPLDPRPLLPEAGAHSVSRIRMMGAYLSGWASDRDIAIPEGIARTVDDLLAQAMEFAQPSSE